MQGVSVLDSTPVFGLCVFYRASLGWRPEAVHIAETAIGLRVQARDALYLLQRHQRPSSFKVIHQMILKLDGLWRLCNKNRPKCFYT